MLLHVTEDVGRCPRCKGSEWDIEVTEDGEERVMVGVSHFQFLPSSSVPLLFTPVPSMTRQFGQNLSDHFINWTSGHRPNRVNSHRHSAPQPRHSLQRSLYPHHSKTEFFCLHFSQTILAILTFRCVFSPSGLGSALSTQVQLDFHP